MNCPHYDKPADIHGAICQPCIEVAESFSKALSQSLLLTSDRNRMTVLSPASMDVDKEYLRKTA